MSIGRGLSSGFMGGFFSAGEVDRGHKKGHIKLVEYRQEQVVGLGVFYSDKWPAIE